jgi:hypothetical protein
MNSRAGYIYWSRRVLRMRQADPIPFGGGGFEKAINRRSDLFFVFIHPRLHLRPKP